MAKYIAQKKTFKENIIQHSMAVVFWGGILIVAGVYFLWLTPLKDNVSQEMVKSEDLQIKLKLKQTELADLQELEKTYNGLDQIKIQRLESLITKGADLPRLYVRFDRLVSAHGLKMDSIDAQKVEKANKEVPDGLGVVDVKLKLSQADYPKIKSFLTAIENSSELMDVIKVSWPEKINTVELEINTYFLK